MIPNNLELDVWKTWKEHKRTQIHPKIHSLLRVSQSLARRHCQQLQWVNPNPSGKRQLWAPDKHATPLLQGRRSLPQFHVQEKKIMQLMMPPKWLNASEFMLSWKFLQFHVQFQFALCQTESVAQGPLTQKGTRPTFPRAMPQVATYLKSNPSRQGKYWSQLDSAHINHFRWIEMCWRCSNSGFNQSNFWLTPSFTPRPPSRIDPMEVKWPSW